MKLIGYILLWILGWNDRRKAKSYNSRKPYAISSHSNSKSNQSQHSINHLSFRMFLKINTKTQTTKPKLISQDIRRSVKQLSFPKSSGSGEFIKATCFRILADSRSFIVKPINQVYGMAKRYAKVSLRYLSGKLGKEPKS